MRKPTGFGPFWSICLVPSKAEAFFYLNSYVPEIADMVHTDLLFTFQDVNQSIQPSGDMVFKDVK